MSWAEEQSWFGTEDMIIDSELEYQENIEQGLWETKDLVLIPISKMSTKHIERCINMIYKSNCTWRQEYLPLLKNELNRRICTK
jgi:hypothetical protein